MPPSQCVIVSTHAVKNIEAVLCSGAHLYWVSDCPHDNVLINCSAHSMVNFMQVIGKSIIATRQRLTLCMQEEHARATVRIFPLLKNDLNFECVTMQQHDSSATSSDLRIIGHLDGNVQFGHDSMITVKSGLNRVDIIQKTVLFLSARSNAHARPCFDIASKNVHCTHGAALGAIDENQVWYLQARGIDCREGEQLLIEALCLAALDKEVPLQVRELVHSMIVANK